MQIINSFINLLGKNYYSEFLININSEIIDFQRYELLVCYNGAFFLELNNYEISSKRKEIFSTIKEQQQQALNELYSLLLSQDKLKLNSYLEITSRTLKSNLNTLKKDFYIDSDQSRYYSILDENQDFQDLEFVYQKNLRNDNFEIDKGVYDIIHNAKSKKVESLYFLGFLYHRYKTLSFIPFSLFQIGKRFLIELDKIKLLNEGSTNENSSKSKNKTKMEETYFDTFCKLIDDCNILSKSTAIGVMIDLQLCIKEIKSETLLELQGKEINRNDHLEFKINEIEKRSYPKNADIKYIIKWINEYQIEMTDILNTSFQGNPIELVLNTHYNDIEKFSPEKDKAYNAQLDFYQYFCRYYANKLIEYFESKMTINESIIIETENANQLSVNQAIILLDKLGVFSADSFENKPNTKKAKLISQLLGKNEKNIKTAIEKLELKKSELGAGYQRDLDKVQQLLNNLE